MDGARPSSGAAATSRGPGGNGHPGGIAESRAHDSRTLATMDGTLRDSCERIRDRVAELAGDARPRVVSEMEAALSQVEYDLNGAEFLLARLREAIAETSAPPRDVPPVAAYRASLQGSRSALDAVREAARLPTRRGAEEGNQNAFGNDRAGERETIRARDAPGVASGVPSPHLRALRGIWKGTVRFVRELLEDPFGDDLDARFGTGGGNSRVSARASRRGEVPGEEALRDAPEESEDYHVSAGYYPAPGFEGRRSRRGEARNGEGSKRGGRSSRRRGGRAGTRGVAPEMSPVMEESSPRRDAGRSSGDVTETNVSPAKPPELTLLDAGGLAPIRTKPAPRPPVRRALVPEGPSLCPESEAHTPRSDAATETDSDVGSETPQGYKALVGMYAGVRIGQSPELEVDASADEVSEADTTPRAKASQSSPSPEEERRREKEEPRPSRPPPRGGGADDVSARDALFSTSSGGDARAPDSDSWKPEGAFDPAVSGRRARRSEKELESELERGVRRLEKGGESLAAAGRLADEANAAGDALLASLRGQTESLARNSEALRQVGSDMEKNEKLVGDMSSWTRLGAKPRRRPWG